MKILVGTSGYSYKEWTGRFYPEKISPKDMLHFYSQRLGTVEINNTFYHMPVARVLTSWAQQVPDDFIFALKAPQTITHRKRLRDVKEETDYLFRTLMVLGKKMGPVLFQFPKSFRADADVLKDFLTLIPGNVLCAFEFRSASWLNADIFDLLSRKGCSLCTADSDENPSSGIIPTASWGYLRLRCSDYSDADISQWMNKILSQKWNQAFVFFKHEEGAIGPEMAMHFARLLNQEEKNNYKRHNERKRKN